VLPPAELRCNWTTRPLLLYRELVLAGPKRCLVKAHASTLLAGLGLLRGLRIQRFQQQDPEGLARAIQVARSAPKVAAADPDGPTAIGAKPGKCLDPLERDRVHSWTASRLKAQFHAGGCAAGCDRGVFPIERACKRHRQVTRRDDEAVADRKIMHADRIAPSGGAGQREASCLQTRIAEAMSVLGCDLGLCGVL
jgi:hypothetical protein